MRWQMLTQKYNPRSLSDIAGNSEAISLLRRWASSWEAKNPASKSVFLYGSPGNGKTSCAIALANDFNWETLEINASDKRNATEIVKILSHAIYFKPWKTRTLIIIDEADYLTKGALHALESLIDESVNPIIIISNDQYAINKVTDYFKTNSLMINFRKLDSKTMLKVLSNIAQSECLSIPDLNKLIDYSSGDLRYAINNIDNIDVPPKELTDNIFSVVHKIFAGNWDGDISDVDFEFLWKVIKYNMPNFYNDIYGINVYEWLSNIDLIMDKVYTNYGGKLSYRFWRYIITSLKMLPPHQKTSKIEIPKFESYVNIQESDVDKLAPRFHMSKSKTYKTLKEFPFLLNPPKRKTYKTLI
jgi:replication factor C large subunit